MEVGFSSPIQGIQNVIDANSARAQRVAKAASAEAGETDSFEKDMAELPQDPPNLGMQTKVIKTKDEMLGTLLDMMA